MPANCHFTYCAICTKKIAKEMLRKIATCVDEDDEEFMPRKRNVFARISEPLGTIGDVLEAAEFDPDDYNETEKKEEAILFCVDGWYAWNYPEQLWLDGCLLGAAVWQIEGDENLYFIPNNGYNPSEEQFTLEDNDFTFDLYFEEESYGDYFGLEDDNPNSYVVFKDFCSLLEKMGKFDEPRPAFLKVDPNTDLGDECIHGCLMYSMFDEQTIDMDDYEDDEEDA